MLTFPKSSTQFVATVTTWTVAFFCFLKQVKDLSPIPQKYVGGFLTICISYFCRECACHTISWDIATWNQLLILKSYEQKMLRLDRLFSGYYKRPGYYNSGKILTNMFLLKHEIDIVSLWNGNTNEKLLNQYTCVNALINLSCIVKGR